MRILTRRRIVPVLCAILLVGCGKSSQPTNPGGGGGSNPGVAQFAAQVGALSTQYFLGNAQAYGSLEVMLPYIVATLSAPSAATAVSAASAVTCFASIAGSTYIFDGTQYVVGPGTGAPSNGVRYVLYRLNPSGQPVLTDSIGYIEVRCTIVNSTTKNVGVSLVANGVAALNVNGSVSESGAFISYTTSGFLAANGVPQQLAIDFTGQLTPEVLNYGNLFATSGLQIDIGTIDSLTINKRTVALSAFYFPSPNWHILQRLHGDAASEATTGGFVSYSDVNTSGIERVVACATGGTLSQPTYSAPSAACDEFAYGVGPAMSAADQGTLRAAYAQVRLVHQTLTELGRHGFGLP